MNVNIIVFLVLTGLSTTVAAQCMGSEHYSTCTDDSGNTYEVTRYGNTTHVDGKSANGTTWSQDSEHYGNQTETTGKAANGATWKETRIDHSNGNYEVDGVDARGNRYSHYCNQSGCN